MSKMMIDVILIVIAIVAFSAAIFFTWTLVGLIRSKVPYVPTSKRIRRKMIELAELKKGQKVYDLGCGDGQILFDAEKFGTKCVGYEIISAVIWFANLKKFFNKSKVVFHISDFFKADLSDSDVVFCYLLPSVMKKLHDKKWKEFKKGTRLISHSFAMKDLKPVKTEKIGGSTIYVYVR